MVGQIRDEVNPFSQKLEDFSRKIAIIITILCLFIVGVLLFEGGAFSHSFLVAVSLAVSAIPEGLPAVVALGLAFATKRLVKRNVLLESAEKHGFIKEELEKKYPIVFEFPFDSDRKRMSILRNTEGAIFSYEK